MNPAAKDVRVLVADDNPLVRDLMAHGLGALCDVIVATDGADALLKAVDELPDLIITDFKMPGLDGRQLYEKLPRTRSHAEDTVYFCGQPRRHRGEAASAGLGRGFSAQAILRGRPGAFGEESDGPAAPGEIATARSGARASFQGRIEEMGVAELMQSLEMGQKSCRLALRRGEASGELFFSAGQCKDARLGELEGDSAVYQVVQWNEGEFEIDFGSSSQRTTTTRSTTGLLMEAMRLLDEANSDRVEQR